MSGGAGLRQSRFVGSQLFRASRDYGVLNVRPGNVEAGTRAAGDLFDEAVLGSRYMRSGVVYGTRALSGYLSPSEQAVFVRRKGLPKGSKFAGDTDVMFGGAVWSPTIAQSESRRIAYGMNDVGNVYGLSKFYELKKGSTTVEEWVGGRRIGTAVDIHSAESATLPQDVFLDREGVFGYRYGSVGSRRARVSVARSGEGFGLRVNAYPDEFARGFGGLVRTREGFALQTRRAKDWVKLASMFEKNSSLRGRGSRMSSAERSFVESLSRGKFAEASSVSSGASRLVLPVVSAGSTSGIGESLS